jgi:hypothetical protein
VQPAAGNSSRVVVSAAAAIQFPLLIHTDPVVWCAGLAEEYLNLEDEVSWWMSLI